MRQEISWTLVNLLYLGVRMLFDCVHTQIYQLTRLIL